MGLGTIRGRCRNLEKGERGTMVRMSVPLVVSSLFGERGEGGVDVPNLRRL
jgi:hypothetical protein